MLEPGDLAREVYLTSPVLGLLSLPDVRSIVELARYTLRRITTIFMGGNQQFICCSIKTPN